MGISVLADPSTQVWSDDKTEALFNLPTKSQLQFTSPATEWVKHHHESVALQLYTKYQESLGHSNHTVCKAGFTICEEQPFLGASPDAYIHYPNMLEQFGLAEVKCLYKYRNVSADDACNHSDFCSVSFVQPDGRKNSVETQALIMLCTSTGAISNNQTKMVSFYHIHHTSLWRQ